MDEPNLPELVFGERFRIESRSGNDYIVRFLHLGERDSGLFVRLDSGEIARLDPRRLRWSSFERTSHLLGQTTIQEGDDVLVECAAGSLRGKLASGLGEEMVRLENGLCVQNSEVYALHLMFRAPSLKAGDRFFLRSNSGRSYSGQCLGITEDSAHVRLDSREEVRMRLAGLNVNTLYVAIPIPRSAYAGYGGDTT